jgi:hypothetical protein
MTPRTCQHEAEVVQAVVSRRWPDACDAALREHAESCEVCREVVAVSVRLQEDFVATRDALARRDVPLPSAGQIWWRAAVRARADATHKATRPLVWGYGVTGACAVGLLAAAVARFWPALLPAFDRITTLTWWIRPSTLTAADELFALLEARLPIVLGVVAFLIAAPIALYVALRED